MDTTDLKENPFERQPGRWWLKPWMIAAWVVMAALLVLVGLQLRHRMSGPVQVGSEVPTFTLYTYDGQQIALESLRGKIVLVNFWASWCKPCEQEAADLEAAWRYYQPRGDVVFLGIAWTDTDAKSKLYLDKFGITYPNGPDLRTSISQKYRITGVPETYIVGRDGKLAAFKFSPYLSVSEIRQAIDPLLGE